MNKDYVTFEIAKKLQEKGYCKLCFATYDKDGMLGYNYCQPTTIRAISFEECMSIHGFDDNCIDAPTISQVMKWLREEKNIHIEIYCSASGYEYIIQDTPNLGGSDILFSDEDGDNDAGCWDTYEESVLAGIEYVLNNLI